MEIALLKLVRDVESAENFVKATPLFWVDDDAVHVEVKVDLEFLLLAVTPDLALKQLQQLCPKLRLMNLL